MSFITPQLYKQLSDNLGDAYAALRDVYNDNSTNVGTSYGEMIAVVNATVEAFDDNISNPSYVNSVSDTTKDPEGSIAGDVGKTMNNLSSTFLYSQAQALAAAQFVSTLSGFNTHVIRRTNDSVRTIASYIDTYAVDDGNIGNEMSLFYQNDGDHDDSYYFSQNFAELASFVNMDLTGYTQA